MADREIIDRIPDRIADLTGLGALEDRGKLKRFLKDLLQWSGKVHLVGRAKAAKNIERQAVDSAIMLDIFLGEHSRGREGKGLEDEAGRIRIADIGAGAGFPGMIWKLLRASFEVVLFERKSKPAIFLEREVRRLELYGVEVVGKDAERYEGPLFDAVVSKAAGRLDVMVPLALGMLKENGVYMTVKGEGLDGEKREAQRRGGELRSVKLPGGRGEAVLFSKKEK